MAGKKDQSLVAKIDGLTTTQAANLKAEITKVKAKVAPNARGTMFSGNNSEIKNYLNGGENNKLLK